MQYKNYDHYQLYLGADLPLFLTHTGWWVLHWLCAKTVSETKTSVINKVAVNLLLVMSAPYWKVSSCEPHL